LTLFFWAVLKIRLAKRNKKIQALQSYTEAVESRLKLAREANIGEASNLAALCAEIDGLRRLIPASDKGSERQPSVLESTLKQVDASAATLIMANGTTEHILTAKTLALGLKRNRTYTWFHALNPISTADLTL
jgi:hypothetical protein